MSVAFFVALATVLVTVICIVWSYYFPEHRIWPPRENSTAFKLVVWLLTLLFFGCITFLGIADWNGLNWPTAFRWGIGLPLIIAGNLVVWRGVAEIGFAATSGDRDHLITDGLYARSRNPQYLADVAILMGWGLLCASEWVWLPVAGGIAALLLAPFAEEPWLESVYGHKYRSYKSATPRFL